MQPHEQRVVDELNALRANLGKLNEFFGTYIFNGLPDAEKMLLLSQQDVMTAYMNILRRRVARF